MRNSSTLSARAQKQHRPLRVLLMVGMEHAHGRGILEGIDDYADHHPRWQNQLEVFLRPGPIENGQVDGMIVEPRSTAVRRALLRTSIPAVTVGHTLIPQGPPAVLVDNIAVGRLAADYLADLGLKFLAYVPQYGSPSSLERGEGFAKQCALRQIPCELCDKVTAKDEIHLARWISDLPEPVGILAAHDRKALQVARACLLAGRGIPEQVALLGVDNEIQTCRLATPPLSSIDHGTRRIGYEAAQLLDNWLTERRRPASPVLVQPDGVVSRQSTDLLAMDNPEVVAAIRFIRAHANEPLKAGAVLRHVAVSRRTLEMHFKQALGRSIHEEIMRVRIGRARQLLITSDWSMPMIADACGFHFPSQFSYAFKRETGVAPQQFRRQHRYPRQKG